MVRAGVVPELAIARIWPSSALGWFLLTALRCFWRCQFVDRNARRC
jgi:hypothetical protein